MSGDRILFQLELNSAAVVAWDHDLKDFSRRSRRWNDGGHSEAGQQAQRASSKAATGTSALISKLTDLHIFCLKFVF